MTTILDQSKVCDGYDVRCQLENGETTVFHFATEPADVQAIVDELGTAYMNRPAPEMPVVPEPIVAVQDTPIEAEFKRQRDAAKVAAIGYIYQNPGCSEADVTAIAGSQAPLLNGSYLLGMYVSGSFEQGYIAENTFAAFVQFILSRTPEELMSI
jgi:hypothetical protein